MDSKSLVFLQLISGPRQYRIPAFQRPYSWEREDRETLWLDILTQYEALVGVWDQPDDEREQSLSSIATHYLGTIVLSGPSSLGVPKSEIIDGQQRITSLLLAICALRDRWVREIASEDGTAKAEAKRNTISNTFLVNDGYEGADRYRVLPLSTDEKVFKAILNHSGSGKLDGDSLGLEPGDSQRMLQAYRFFKTEMARKSVPDGNPQLKRFASLFPLRSEIIEQALAHRLSVIAIETKNKDDTNAIFESLNAKGRPLTQLDLLRNYVFMSLGNKAEATLNEWWLPVEKAHLPERADMEAFVWADVVSRGTNVLQKRTYRTVQSELREQGADAAAALVYVQRLNRRAPMFAKVLSPATFKDPARREAMTDLAQSGGKTARPLLLWLLDEEQAGRCDADETVRCVRHIESFLVRRFLCAMPPNNLNSMFGVMLSRLNRDLGFLPDDGTVEERLLKALSASPKEWPDDDALASGVASHDFYHNGDVRQRIQVLRRLDLNFGYDLRPGYEESDESIEHIMPQSRPNDWVADLASLGQELTSVQERLLHTLGNLTIVSPSDNSKLGNKRFAEKAKIYKTLGYKLTQRVTESGVEISGDLLWGAEEIEARANELSAACIKVWRRPKAHVVESVEGPMVELEDGVDDEDAVPFTSSIDETEGELDEYGAYAAGYPSPS